MEFTVKNSSLLYSFSFTEETARISVKDLSNGLYASIIKFPSLCGVLLNTSDNSLTPIIRVRFQLRRISLQLKRWDTKLLLLVDTTILTLLGQNFRRTTSLATFNILSLGKKGKFPTLGSLARMSIKF